MTPEERRMLEDLDDRVRDIEYKIERVISMDDRVRSMEQKLSRILNIVIGIAVGLAVGAVVFGFLSIRDLVSIVK
jgi:tetrahydromethanopterin S-methyltransferase subunit G